MQNYQKILYQLNNTLENLTAEVAALRQQPLPASATATAAPVAPFSPEALMDALVKLRAGLDAIEDVEGDGDTSGRLTELAAMQDTYDMLLDLVPIKRVSYTVYSDVPMGIESLPETDLAEYIEDLAHRGKLSEILEITDAPVNINGVSEYHQDVFKSELRSIALEAKRKLEEQ